jgi:molybdate transport system regulatory protein
MVKEGIKYSVKSRIWICTKEGTFLGEGRVELLKKIEEYGSISKAAQAMKMSYKKAWELVNSMNKQSKNPLVVGAAGGVGGGGSILSDSGHNAILLFSRVIKRNQEYLNRILDDVEQELN